MALPFKNGEELAQALGYGDLYRQSKQQEQEAINGVKEMIERMTKCERQNLQERYD